MIYLYISNICNVLLFLKRECSDTLCDSTKRKRKIHKYLYRYHESNWNIYF